MSPHSRPGVAAEPFPGATVAALKRVPFLAPLGEAAIATLAARAKPRNFSRGEPLCQEGQVCSGFWVVTEGSIQSVASASTGKTRILERAGTGGTCCMVCTLGADTCPVRTEARRRASALFVSRTDLLEVLQSTPGGGLALARHFESKLKGLTTQLASLSLKDVRSRVAAHLLDEASARGRTEPDGRVTLRLEGSQGEIAHRLGTEREVFARTLRHLKDEGVIDHVRDRVSIRDVARLRALAGSTN